MSKAGGDGCVEQRGGTAGVCARREWCGGRVVSAAVGKAGKVGEAGEAEDVEEVIKRV